MESSYCTVQATGGGEVNRFLDAVAAQLVPSRDDLLWLGNVVKTGILDKTAAGLDYRGTPFAPYSEKGPFYFYPAGSRTAINRKASVRRIQKRLRGGKTTRTGMGIKFDSYADFKRSLGRSGVDLRGPSAPHMLQAIVVRIDGETVYVGIYDSFAADKASGHNDGIHKHLPRREFFNVTDHNLNVIARDLADRLVSRTQAYLR